MAITRVNMAHDPEPTLAEPSWVEVYSAAHAIEAQMLVGLLQANGLQAGLRGLSMGGAIGEVPLDALATAIYTPPEQKARAYGVIISYEASSETPWTCPQCQEENGGQFEFCWQCQLPPNA
ncbi:MAG: DUF2007 domain-containing protein [Gammaproteobacteria bacterium]|nr:DUF2007 domain-containing protein [Gammaproteobacteria bacterium]